MDYKVEIMDSLGISCRIKLSLPFFKKQTRLDNSQWRTSGAGNLKYRFGGCQVFSTTGIDSISLFNPLIVFGQQVSTGDLVLFVGEDWVIGLSKFLDVASFANSSGVGKIDRKMCWAFMPGKISWVLIE